MLQRQLELRRNRTSARVESGRKEGDKLVILVVDRIVVTRAEHLDDVLLGAADRRRGQQQITGHINCRETIDRQG